MKLINRIKSALGLDKQLLLDHISDLTEEINYLHVTGEDKRIEIAILERSVRNLTIANALLSEAAEKLTATAIPTKEAKEFAQRAKNLNHDLSKDNFTSYLGTEVKPVPETTPRFSNTRLPTSRIL